MKRRLRLVAAAALFAGMVGHGEIRLQVCAGVAVGVRCARVDLAQPASAPALAAVGNAVRSALRTGRVDTLRRQFLAAQVRRRSPLVKIGAAEIDYWAALSAEGLPARATGSLQRYAGTLRLAADVANGRLNPAALWRSGLLRPESTVRPLGAPHDDRVATLTTALVPALGTALVRAEARRAARQGSGMDLARALLRLSALALRNSEPERAGVLAARSARLVGLHGDGAAAYVSLAQSVDLDGASVLPRQTCELVPEDRLSIRVNCWLDLLRGARRGGHVAEGLSIYARLAPRVPEMTELQVTRLALAAGPMLAASGQWSEFEALARDGIAAGERLDRQDDVSRLWSVAATVARARGEFRQAEYAVAAARAHARTPEALAAAEVVKARGAFARGDATGAVDALLAATSLVPTATGLPLDAMLLARDLGMAGKLGGVERRVDSSHPLRALVDLVELMQQVPGPESVGPEHLDNAARSAMSWAYEMGGARLRASLGVATDLWARVADAHLDAGGHRAALAAVELGRAGGGTEGSDDELRAAIPDHAGVIVYGRIGQDLFWWAADRHTTRFGRVGVEPQAVRRMSRAYADMLWSHPQRSTRPGSWLTRVLLVPPLAATGWNETKSALIVVPGAELAGLPFAALPWDSDRGEYLDDRFQVSRAATLAEYIRASRVSPRRGRHVAFVPRAGRDAEAEARIFAEFGGEAFLGARATRRAFTTASPGAALLHYGGHTAYRDDGHSQLTFAGGEQGHRPLAGVDIARLDLRGAVVVLLGCETAQYVSGRNGLPPFGSSIASEFMRAGSRGVAATLWPLTDRMAAEITHRLYDSKSVPTAQSVADVRRELRREFPDEPRRWAGLVWYGAAGDP